MEFLIVEPSPFPILIVLSITIQIPLVCILPLFIFSSEKYRYYKLYLTLSVIEMKWLKSAHMAKSGLHLFSSQYREDVRSALVISSWSNVSPILGIEPTPIRSTSPKYIALILMKRSQQILTVILFETMAHLSRRRFIIFYNKKKT